MLRANSSLGPYTIVELIGSGGMGHVMTKDGKKFLVAVPQSASAAAPLTVLLNWSAAVPK
jgi:hypothetical protein